MKKIILILLIGLYSTLVMGKNISQRRCLLLPVQDEVGGAIGFGVFEEVEKYLKDSEWCYYNSNAEILNILTNYKKNLKAHLGTPEVLKILAEKTQSGSLIKVEILNEIKGATISMSIVGANGSDVYFKEKSTVENNEIAVMAQKVKNWLDQYDKQIPFDGIVTGILGSQFTVDMGQASGVYANNQIVVVRPTQKKRHPLLKEIVEFDTEKIADGKIFHVTRIQSQGEIKSYDSRKRIQLGDWVLLNKDTKTLIKDGYSVKKKDDYQFGRLGTVSVLLGVGSSSDKLSDTSSVTELGGVNFGVLLKGEVWATRNYWAGLNIGKKFSSTSVVAGTSSNAPDSITLTDLDIIFAYRYLPMGFFYGPRVDLMVGYGSYDYDLDAIGGFSESNFSGFMLGVKGSMPLQKKVRLFVGLDFLLSPTYTEQTIVNGAADSATSYHVSIGGQYTYSPRMTLDASFDIRNNKANFRDPSSSVTVKDTAVNIGSTFTF